MAKKTAKKQAKGARQLRSQMWFNNPDNPVFNQYNLVSPL